MKQRLLLAVPVLFTVALVLVAGVVGDSARPTTLAIGNEAGKVIALVGCFIAVLVFERGDYLSRAWSTTGLCYLLLIVNDAVGAAPVASRMSVHEMGAAQGALVVAANVASVVGTWMLARAWSFAGLEDSEDDDARVRRRVVFAGTIAAALAITAWPLVHDVRDLASGHLDAIISIASDVGDAICLALVAPLLLTALALRGGVLLWPWAMLTASGLAWLVYDATSGVVDALDITSTGWVVFAEGLRALACALTLSAGLAQRIAVRFADQPDVPAA
ncbi:MAG TPA: hypothetical protein VF737_04230 [Gemmatimonadaceae bacterium]